MANLAELFIVPKVPIDQPLEQDEMSECEPLELSGDVKVDTETALRALAFLMDFMSEVGPGELRRSADEIRAFRVRQ